MTELIPALSVGSIEGGRSPTMPRWREAVTRLTIKVDALSTDVDTPLNLNVIFQIPGNIIRPDFEGVRTGHYDRLETSLIVQAALPDQPPADIDAYLRDVLAEAVDSAERWAQKKGVASNLAGIRTIVDRLRADSATGTEA